MSAKAPELRPGSDKAGILIGSHDRVGFKLQIVIKAKKSLLRGQVLISQLGENCGFMFTQ